MELKPECPEKLARCALADALLSGNLEIARRLAGKGFVLKQGEDLLRLFVAMGAAGQVQFLLNECRVSVAEAEAADREGLLMLACRLHHAHVLVFPSYCIFVGVSVYSA